MGYNVSRKSIFLVEPYLIELYAKKGREVSWSLPTEETAFRFAYRLRQALFSADRLNFDPYKELKDAYKFDQQGTTVYAIPKVDVTFKEEFGMVESYEHTIVEDDSFSAIIKIEMLKGKVLLKPYSIIVEGWAKRAGYETEKKGDGLLIHMGSTEVNDAQTDQKDDFN